MGKTVVLVQTPKVLDAEKDLLAALDMVVEAKKLADDAKKVWLAAMAEAGCTTSGRSEQLQITYYRSSGSLQADAIARYYGCSVEFLRKFRRLGRATIGVRKCKPRKQKSS